jgi:homocysteine S-methyltransferase
VTNAEALRLFSDQANSLAAGGVDFLFLETFSNVAELLIAIEAAAATGLEIVAQMSVAENGMTIYGLKIGKAVSQIAKHPAVTAVGLNCAIGPLAMLNSLKEIRKVTDKPIAAQPNAGRPQEVEGRTIYMCTPEYMAEYAKRFYENGVRIIGGCCGTSPEHIKQIARAVRPMDKAGRPAPSIRVSTTESAKATGHEPVPLAERSKLGKKLANEEPITCIELLPPKGADMSALIDKIKLCADHGIDAINIPDGPRASSRLSPMVTAIKTQQVADIETILHVCCRDRNIISMQSDMLGVQAMGLKNVLLITGDPPKLGEYPDATAVFDLDSIALTAVVDDLNRGLDIAGNELPEPLSLTIGVGANPVASDLHREIDRFKQKAAAGAEYAITQPVFDTEMFYTFQAAVAECKVPLVAGIWPFTSYKNAEFMANEVPGVVVPKEMLNRMSAAKTREQARRLGIEIAREMIEQLSEHIAGFAVSAPFGNVKIALAALGRIDIEKT